MTAPNETVSTNGAPACPKCSGPCWDNRMSKRSPSSPDFRCRNNACEGRIWPSRGGAVMPPPATPPATAVASPPPAVTPTPVPAAGASDFTTLAALHRKCLAFVAREEGPLLEGATGDLAGAVAALAGSLFAELRRGGHR